MNRASTQNITSYKNVGMGKFTVIPPIIISKSCTVNTCNLEDCMTLVTKDNHPSKSDDEV